MKHECKATERNSWRKVISNNLYSMKFTWQYARAYVIFQFVNVIVESIYLPLNLILTAHLFTVLEEEQDFHTAISFLIAMGLILVLRLIWHYLFNNILSPRYQQLLHLKIQTKLFEKVKLLDYERYDDPQYYNDFILVMQHTDLYANSAANNLTTFLQVLFALIATFGILVYVDFTIMCTIFISTIISILVSVKLKRIEYVATLNITPITKIQQYINRVYKLPDYAKELRLTKFNDILMRDYDKAVNEHIQLSKEYGKRKVWLKILDSLNSDVVYLGVIALTMYKVVVGTVSIGGLTVIVNANWQFRNALVRLANLVTTLPQQSLFMSKVREFIDFVPIKNENAIPVRTFEDLEFCDVSFSYNQGKAILDNFNIKIRHGEHIAIVGCNGAGKSTIIKLLLGLYRPNVGNITYNGTDIHLLNQDDYRKKFGVVFQDYKIFAATVAENVLADEYTDADYTRVEQAVSFAMLKERIDSLPNGILTMLTREFDNEGVNLSGGEMQKIAIARAFASDHDILIMDEPSSALDPVAEYELNYHINKYTKDKTVIFISHRLTTTRYADKIYVVDEGKVIESGSHDQLLAQKGKYAEMFKVQAERYLTRKT